MYKRSIEDPAGFWSDIASQFYWKKRWGDQVFEENLDVRKGNVKIEVIYLNSIWILLSFFFSYGSVCSRVSGGCSLCVCVDLLHCISGSRVGSPTSVIIAWIDILKLD